MSFKNTTKQSFFWSFLIQFSFQSIGFIVSVMLARILMPADFGIIGMITIFITIGRLLVDGGLGSSLVRSKDLTQLDYSTVFFSNILMSVVLYVVLFILSPFIAAFFEYSSLEALLKVYGLVFIISSFSTVQSTRLNKNLQFKTQFKLLLPSLLISAAVAVWMAYSGYGVWSLVGKEIVFAVLASIQLWLYSKWTPTFAFDKAVFKHHFNFGYKIMLTETIKSLFNDSNKVVIGKMFTPTQLGLFTRAQSMQELPTSILFNAFNRVAFPLLSQINNDDVRLKSVYRRLVAAVSFVVIPLLLFLGLFAHSIFILLLTAKWNAAVPYFQILVLAGIFAPLRTYNLNICKVKGRSDMVLKFTILECVLIALNLTLIIWFGIYGLLYGLVIINILLALITGYFSGLLIDYKLRTQLMDILPIFLLAATTILITYVIDLLLDPYNDSHIVRLTVGAISAFCIYFTGAYLFKFKSLNELLTIVKKRKI